MFEDFADAVLLSKEMGFLDTRPWNQDEDKIMPFIRGFCEMVEKRAKEEN
ncbi:hypothetical protein [Salininema proteolyticum]|uniref:Uncharacterized protein n=1 Tax=Salininema proteolyticum TaxID=1607685 RepID=A0ABV8U3C8_9ACTN